MYGFTHPGQYRLALRFILYSICFTAVLIGCTVLSDNGDQLGNGSTIDPSGERFSLSTFLPERTGVTLFTLFHTGRRYTISGEDGTDILDLLYAMTYTSSVPLTERPPPGFLFSITMASEEKTAHISFSGRTVRLTVEGQDTAIEFSGLSMERRYLIDLVNAIYSP
jgi:hypothetical protein